MITKKLKQLVINEATNLKKYASAEERARLDFKTFDPTVPSLCIYGQIAVECRSGRALSLLNHCAVPYSDSLEGFDDDVHEDFKGLFSGFSPIEFYICQPKAKNKNLINFLKGETETLTIDEL